MPPKQKTLLAFFGTPKNSSQQPNKKLEPQTTPTSKPRTKGSLVSTVSNSTPASSSASKSKDKDTTDKSSLYGATVIDDDEDDGVEVPPLKTSTTRHKRKILSESESGDDAPSQDTNAFAERLVGFKKTPSDRHTKRPRTASVASSDIEPTFHSSTRASATSEEAIQLSSDEEDESPVKSKAKHTAKPTGRTLTKGRKSVASSSRASSDNEDKDAVSNDSDGSEAEEPKPKGKKGIVKATERPTIKPSGSSSNFLTAAEQRKGQEKTEKKGKEDCFEFLKDRRDKDGNRPDSPNFDPRSLYIPKSAWKSFTPFETQFWTIKQNQYDTVLFFQKGKFYELYESDAEIGHQEFDLKLTDRVKMKMVGVPEMSFDFWAAKFLARGYKVGRVDQTETQLGAEMRQGKKGGKGKADIVQRELGKVLTNGTLVDANMLTDEQAGHLVSLREDEDTPNSFGLCVLDAATGQFNLSNFVDDVCGTKLETIIRQLRPKEILFTKGNLSISTTRLLKALLSSSCLWTPLRQSEGLRFGETIDALKELYPPPEDGIIDDGLLPESVPEAIRSMKDNHAAMEALGGMIWYLRTLNLDQDMLSMKNFNIYDPMRKGLGLVLDGQTLAHIEVLRNSEGTEEGSLLKLLSNCITPFGKRLFRLWICMPLREVKAINDRLDAVDDLMDNPNVEDTFTELAKGLPDLERVVSRIHAGSCKPKDFLKVLESFRRLSEGFIDIANAADSFKSQSVSGLLRSAPDLGPYVNAVESMFVDPEKATDDLMPRKGKDNAFDEIEGVIQGLEETLDKQLKGLQKTHGAKELEWWHSGVGTKEIYLVQSSSSFKAPKSWTKNSATKAKTRWIVPELVGTVRELKEARENRKTVLKEFKSRLYAFFDTDRSTWLHAVEIMAELDCLYSLAKSSSALGAPSCRPEFVEADEAFVNFEGLRHPAISLKDSFIPNTVRLGGEKERIVLLTGPNMGGKSTVMRMTAVGVIMAQLGMHVPAQRARLAPVDAILTRMGAYDNMFSNSSTFKVEMDECCKILREATPKSLVILDELGRGTSTFDGMAIAGAVLHQLATHTLALSCFATHYSSLTDDYAYHPNIQNMHMATMMDEEDRRLVFTYKLTPGIASSSFGTHVASLAGVPSNIVSRAETVSNDFAKHFQAKLAKKRADASKIPLVAQADFAYLFRLAMANGDADEPDGEKASDGVHQAMVLRGLKKTVGKYVLL